jgi:hypothetical protein
MINREEKRVTRDFESVGIHKNNGSVSVKVTYKCFPHGSLCCKIGSKDTNQISTVTTA